MVTASPYRDLTRTDFDDALDFVATGGYFAQSLVAGDTFSFGGQLLEFVRIRDMAIGCKRARGGEPKVPVYGGDRLPISTHLAERVRGLLADRATWPRFPDSVREWLALQDDHSVVPDPESLVIESFPREGKEFTVVYPFEGRNAHQTLGMLLTRRMERLRLSPLGFVASDYVVAMWSLRLVEDPAVLFTMDLLGDELEDWLADSSMMRRTFRNVAIIAGLIERRSPGQEKSRRQMTMSSDLIYDVLPFSSSFHAGAHQGPHRPPQARQGLTARGAGAAGDRPRGGLRRLARRTARRDRPGSHRRSDGLGSRPRTRNPT